MRCLSVLIISFFIASFSARSQDVLPSAFLEDKEGNAVELSEYVKDGKPKIISLWATWCGPCRMELNALKKVYPKWKELYKVEIITITVDFPSMLNRAKKMFDQNDWQYTFLYDKNQELMGKLGIRGIPYSMLIDGKGTIQSVHMGYFPGYEKDLEKKIKALKS